MGYSLIYNNTRSSFIYYPLCFLIDAVPSLRKREDEKDVSDRSSKNSPRCVKIIAQKHSTPSRPPALAIIIQILTKLLVIDFLEKSIVVKLVEEGNSIRWIQPVIDDLILTEYVHVLGSVDEVVYEHSIGSEPWFTIWEALFKADEISKEGFCYLMNIQTRDFQDSIIKLYV